MSGTDLRALREYVANVLDYDPNNDTYRRQIDRLLNEADRSIFLAKPFTFINKAVEITAYKDREASLGFTNGNQVVTAGAAFFESWMVNQEVEADGKTYRINAVDSATQARIERGFESATGNYASKVINRYLDLPSDCTSVLNVARRTNTRTPNDPGMLKPLTRYEDEWNNLPLGEVNLPVYWMNYDPAFITGPRRNFNISTAGAGGAGVRTVEFTSTYIQGGRESSHGEIITQTFQDNQDPVLTPFVGVANDGLRKRYYFRSPSLGYHAWRLLDDPTSPGDSMDLSPTDVAARTYTGLDLNDFAGGESLYNNVRLAYTDGFVQRVRLYPRQDKDYVFTVRYMQRHKPMQEDGDVSAIPPDHRMLIAYRALADIFVKHDNLTQSELYRRRFDEMMLRLERRYLITPARRIVKGNWLTNMEPNSFNRYTTLVHT
jgi:hypothetical protein